MIKSYTQLINLQSHLERYNYLKLQGEVANITFGYDRYLNQILYASKRWKQVRDSIIIRDEGCDLGIQEFKITGKVIVHHINPLTIKDIELEKSIIFDPDNLICVSHNTHNAIHYGNEKLLPQPIVERTKNDTCPWA